jgi:PLP dependent protein
MAVTRNRIETNLKTIRQNIAAACRAAGRNPKGVRVLAVTKTVDVETIRNLLDLGMLEFGESRAQQLTNRAAEIDGMVQRRRKPLAGPVRWHMVGHLQRNKVRSVLQWAQTVHSIDSLRLAEELSDRAGKMELQADVFLQVNCAKEQQKFGCAVGAATHLAEMIVSMPHIRLAGLMTMGPTQWDADETRHSFIRLRELLEEMHKEGIVGPDCDQLSMGMSRDYTIAVEEGATILRIGSALFE